MATRTAAASATATMKSMEVLRSSAVRKPAKSANMVLKPTLAVRSSAGQSSRRSKARVEVEPIQLLPSTVADLQALQRQRSVILKSRNMQANRLQAIVAGTLGYSSSMAEKDRKKKFGEATELIKAVANGTTDHPMKAVILTTLTGIDAFNEMKVALEKSMIALAQKLPIAAWVERPEQRGFGLLFLAIVIGETGDLNNYANPAKVWRRMGCAPWSFDGETRMGSSWRGKKLPASEWEAFGYSPRRRSIAFLIGEGIVKQNTLKKGPGEDERKCDDDANTVTPGPYRLRYDEAKSRAKEVHPDWTPQHCHRHGMLLATKLLLKNLWIEWRREQE